MTFPQAARAARKHGLTVALIKPGEWVCGRVTDFDFILANTYGDEVQEKRRQLNARLGRPDESLITLDFGGVASTYEAAVEEYCAFHDLPHEDS